MSIQLLSSVWNYDVTGNTRAVIQVLCDYANDEGVCWPANDAIAFKVGVSKRQVQRILVDLHSRGVIEDIEQGGHGPKNTNRIRVNLLALPAKKGDIYVSPINGEKDDIQVSPLAKGDKGDISTHKGDISGHKGDTQMSPEPLTEPPVEPSEENDTLPSLSAAYPKEFERFWSAYPRKVKKGHALKAWNATKKLRPSTDVLIQVIEAQSKSVQWSRDGGRWIPHPSTWLNDRQWDDVEEIHISVPWSATDPMMVKPPGCGVPLGELLRMDVTGEWMPDKYREIVRAYKASH